MHLTLLTQYYPPEIGAPQARLSELAAHFVSRGHSVTVLTAMPNYPKGKIHAGYGGVLLREKQNGANVIRTFIYPTQKVNLAPRMANYLSFVLSSSIVGSTQLKQTDYLLVESPPLFLGLAAVWLSALKRARMIFNVSDLWPESAVRLGVLKEDSLAFRLSAKLESYCYQRAWLVTGQSKAILADINDRFPHCSTFHLSNGVDTSKFSPKRSTDRTRALLTQDRRLVVLYAGLHGVAQGLDQALEAAEAVQDLNVQFVLIGDGPEKEALVRRARERQLKNVRFLDAVSAQEMPPIIASADIILVPLKTYIPGAVPSKLYEAMASERPVMLVADGEAADTVRAYDAGLAVKPGNITGLVEALRALSSQPEARKRMGANGRRATELFFDRAQIVGGFIRHLEAHLCH
ncbi:MAG: glycosyltransferase family 4 protein [Nitrospirota bacterium]